MKTTIIIPARMGSTRFPDKPRALIKGKSLLQRVWEIAKSVKDIEAVYIATDAQEIRQLAISFGASVIMTPKSCDNGSIRAFYAIKELKEIPDVVINLQGDAPLTPPWIIQDIIEELQQKPDVQIATPAAQLDWKQLDSYVKYKEQGRTSGTLVVFDKNQNALYFSKGIIPFIRDKKKILDVKPHVFRHIGLYAYRFSALEKYASLKPTPLEELEQLEQLRALENGLPIRVRLVDYRGRTPWSVDLPEDVAVVESIIEKEGELLV